MEIDLDFFKELLRIPSVTSDVAEVNRAVAAMRAWLEARGLRCETERMADGREFLYASVRGERTPRLLLNAHLDVVPAAPAFFEPREKDGALFGRGTADCKGNAVAIACAMAALAGSGASVGALFSTDEEAGGETSGEAVARGIRATGLTAVLDAASRSITHAQKGILSLRLVAKGRGGHSSEPWAFDNPIDRLFDAWARVRAAWPAIPEDKWGDSLAATVVRAGEVHNQIPDEAEMVANVRFVRPGDADRIEREIREVSGLEVERLNLCEPVFCDESAPALALLRDAMREAFGCEIPFRRMHGATDARHFSGPGAAPVAILGVEGWGCHNETEGVSLASVSEYADMLVVFARSFAAVAGN